MLLTLYLLLLFTSLGLAVPVLFASVISPGPSYLEGRDVRDEKPFNTVYGLFSETAAPGLDTEGDLPPIAAVFRSMELTALTMSSTVATLSTSITVDPVPSPTQAATWSPTAPLFSDTLAPLATSLASQPDESSGIYGHAQKSVIAAYLVGVICVLVVCAFLCKMLAKSGMHGCYRRKQPDAEQVNTEWAIQGKPSAMNEPKLNDRCRETRVINIRSGFPFSRFSDYSSEECCSSTGDLSLEADNLPPAFYSQPSQASVTRPISHATPLLCPADFFSLPSASSIALVTRQLHTRAMSAPERRNSSPIFGHARPKSRSGQSMAGSE